MATSITLTTNSASTEYTLATGGRGPAGADGATGATGPAGTTLTAGTGINITAGVVSSTVTGNATHTGDATGATALTLATVNSNVGSFTNASLTVNAKGLVTAASSGTAPVTSVTGTAGMIKVLGTTDPVISLPSALYGLGSVAATTFTGALTGNATTSSSTTGNAATVTTNANLTGHITSVGNAASLGSFTLAQLDTATSDATLARTDDSGGTQTFAGAQAFSSATRPTSAATTGTLAAADASSLITKGDGDVRFIQKTITSLPTANYTSSSGQNQAWITESWIIPAQTNGLGNSNSVAGFAVNGLFVIHASGLGKSLQIFPALTIGVSTVIAGAITDGGVFNSTFCFNVGAGSVDLLANVISSRMKLSSSGVSSRHLRYRFSTNFAANAGDVIVMNTTGHTFVVDTTVTDATVFTNASTGGVTVRAITGGSAPTTADTSLTVNGGAPITTTYQINSASNTGVHPACILFASSTGIHLLGTTISSNGTYRLTGYY